MDTDHTLVKGVYSPEFARPENVHHPSIEQVASNGNGAPSLQCGQSSITHSVQRGDTLVLNGNDVNTDVNEDDEPLIAYVYSDVITDRLDQYVDGLPRDLYVQTLLKSTHSCEETLSMYRLKLSERAKQCENGPSGTLITRKNTTKKCASEKYALD